MNKDIMLRQGICTDLHTRLQGIKIRGQLGIEVNRR